VNLETHKLLSFILFYIYSYTWQIFLRCTAGGRYDSQSGVEQHLEDTQEVKVFLYEKSSSSISQLY
jgi:hypothetical protein